MDHGAARNGYGWMVHDEFMHRRVAAVAEVPGCAALQLCPQATYPNPSTARVPTPDRKARIVLKEQRMHLTVSPVRRYHGTVLMGLSPSNYLCLVTTRSSSAQPFGIIVSIGAFRWL